MMAPEVTSSGNAGGSAAGGSGGRNGNGGRNRNRRPTNATTPRGSTKPKFVGMESDLQGSVFNYSGDRNPEMWLKTVRAIQKFVGKKFPKYTGDLVEAVGSLELNDPQQPGLPTAGDLTALEFWKLELKEYRDRVQEYANFRASLYAIVMGQCSPAMEDRLRNHEDFENAGRDGLAILRIIRMLLHSFDETRQHYDAMNEIKCAFWSIRQGKHESLQDYYHRYMALYDVVKELRIAVVDEGSAYMEALADGRDQPNDADWAAAKDQAAALNFVRGASNRNPSYRVHLRNAFLDGNDVYPTTVVRARTILLNRNEGVQGTNIVETSTAFTQSGDISGVRCFRCQQLGHFARDCDQPVQTSNVAVTDSASTGTSSGTSGAQESE